jgi:hypothetical protein
MKTKCSKNVAIFLTAAMLFFGCSGNRTWTKGDVIRETAYLAVTAVDWRQTRTISKNPDLWYETNGFLGKHPTTSEVDRYFLAMGVGHVIVTHLIPHPYRQWWQYGSIGFSSYYVIHNNSIGIKIDW